MKNVKRMEMNQWLKTGCFIGCLLFPFTATAITFDEEPTVETASQATAEVPIAPSQKISDSTTTNLEALAGHAELAADEASAEVAPIAGRKSSERGLLSWIALALLGVGAFGTLILLKKKKAVSEGEIPGLEVMQSIRVGAKHQVSLVRVPGATLVLGVTEKGIQTLAQLPAQSSTMSEVTSETAVEANSPAPVEEAPNPFLDKVLNMTHRSSTPSSSNPFSGMGDLSADSERRAVLKRLEQYRQTI